MRVLAVAPHRRGAVDFYRGSGVLSEMRGVEVTYVTSNTDISSCKGYDVIYFIRPDREDYLIAAQVLKGIVKIVVDYDDYLLRVPEGNIYHKNQVLHDNPYEVIVGEFLKLADVVVVSTEELRRRFSEWNKRVVVVRNAFDDYCFRPDEMMSFKKVVLWRGGIWHKPDIEFYRDEIIRLIKENSDFEFIFWGVISKRKDNMAFECLLDEVKIKVINAVEPLVYIRGLQKMSPSVIMAVDAPVEFNYCVSDIAKLEGYYCGALCIHPDWEEWQWGFRPDGRYLYEQGMMTLERVRKQDKSLKDVYRTGLELVKSERLLSQANVKRLEIFNAL